VQDFTGLKVGHKNAPEDGRVSLPKRGETLGKPMQPVQLEAFRRDLGLDTIC
jgi:hypothetical protein